MSGSTTFLPRISAGSRLRGRVLAWLTLVVPILAVTGCSPDGTESGAAATVEGGSAPSKAVELETPVPKPSFVLTDVSDGEPFDFRQETRGFVTLLFIGYTHCPDVCPVHMANLGAVLPELPARVQDRIRVVFISSDPARDTPERIRTWLSSFHPDFIGLRGTRAEVNAIEEALGFPSSVVEESGSTPEDPEDYFVGHAAQVLVFETDDTARVAYPWGTRQQDWRLDLPRLVTEEGS